MSFRVLQLRRDSASNWTAANPTLADGEIVWEESTNLFKIGDGSTAWTSLSYLKASATHNGFLTSTDWSTFNSKVGTTRTIGTTAPLTGGGDLSADRTIAVSDFVGSGASHARGTVPDPGSTAGTARFLREDGQWTPPASGHLFYPENSVNSDVAGDSAISATYKVASDTPSANAESDLVINSPTTGAYVLGQGFATVTTHPNITSLPVGTAYRYIYAKVDTGTASIKVDLFRYKTTGNEATTGAHTNFSFVNGGAGNADTIHRTTGSFITDGFTNGCLVTVSGALNAGNNTSFTVQTVTATDLTLIIADNVTVESAGNSITIVTKERLLRIGNSSVFSDTNLTLQVFTYSDSNSYVFASNDRIIFKWWAAKQSGPSTRTITIATEGTGFQSYIQTTIGADAGTSTVPANRQVITTSPLAGGGDLTSDRTLSIADAAADGTTKGAAAFTAADFNATSGVVSIDYTNGQKATASVPGFLTAADWTTFNNKHSVISANQTFYVRTDGNDTHDGSANTAGAAFLTIQHACNVVAGLYIAGGVVVTIQIADGTYNEAVVLPNLPSGGTCLIQGNTGTPANVIVQGGAGAAFTTGTFSQWTISGMEIRSTSLYGINAQSGSILVGSSIRFGVCGNHQCVSQFGGIITFTASYSIVGAAPTHITALWGGQINLFFGATVTVSGTPAFSQGFCICQTGSTVFAWSQTYSGSATGKRYSAVGNGVIDTNAGGANYFPGNVAGTTATGGQYI